MVAATAFALLAAGVAVSALPTARHAQTVTVPLSHRVNVTSPSSLVAAAQARLRKINGEHRVGNVDASSGTVTNADVSYLASVSITGNTYQLIVDTGSSNTWCGAQGGYSGDGQDTGDSVMVSYGSGSFSGEEYTGPVSFGGLTVSSQSFGGASSSNGFSNVDGIIGFGPVDLTEGTVSNTNEVPTFMDNLYSQGSISTEVLGVSFAPESGSDTDDANGELTLGGTDPSRYSGSITYFPTLQSGAASAYWGISISSFSYGSDTLSGSGSGIVDTGTTLIMIPTSAYNNFLSATGGTTDSSSGLASFTTEPTQDFVVEFSGSSFTLTPSQYLVPQAQYSYYGLTSGKYYSWINNGGDSGVDTIIGQKFMENYYAVFDTTNQQIGFAPRS